MNRFFEEYVWVVVTMIGGSLGLYLVMDSFIGQHAPFLMVIQSLFGVL